MRRVNVGFDWFFVNINCLLASQLLEEGCKDGIIIKVVVLVVVAVVVDAGTLGTRTAMVVTLSFGIVPSHVLLINILGNVLSNTLNITSGWVGNRSFDV